LAKTVPQGNYFSTFVLDNTILTQNINFTIQLAFVASFRSGKIEVW